MKLLENTLPGSQENEIESSKLFWFSNRSTELVEFDLETLKQSFHKLSLPEFIDQGISMCPLPGKKLFCYGNWTFDLHLTGITFIIDENYNIKFLPNGTPNLRWFTIYHDNCVYAFRGIWIEMFNLNKNRWKTLTKIPCGPMLSSCTSLENKILVSGYQYEDIFVYDLFALSFSWCNMNFKGNIMKILCSYENCAYLIDFSGKIFQSEANNPFKWTIIKNWYPNMNWNIDGKRAFYKDCWYFLTAYSKIIKFDLKKKEIEEVLVSLKQN